ncbi:MAG: hypothetical protein JWN27_2994 [Candidatus Eremiobacteraeota bacterium]|nr:hypothetical protein [Candidatus Eremiobacteraeota bacterium]
MSALEAPRSLVSESAQEDRLRFMLDVTRQTYNALLDERRYAWRARGITVTAKMQYAEITAGSEARADSRCRHGPTAQRSRDSRLRPGDRSGAEWPLVGDLRVRART